MEDLPEPATPRTTRPSFKFICELPPGARLAMVGERMVMVAPDHPPCWVTPEGVVPVQLNELPDID